MPPSDPPLSLAERLRTQTEDLHRRAERGSVVRALLDGSLSPAGYRQWLLQYRALYGALEAALDRAQARNPDDPWLQPLADPRLRRTPALEQDLADLSDLAPAPWQVLEVTRDYVERLATLDTPRLLAHAYVRYLGDLSGGQLLGPRVAALIGRGAAHATAFYRFDPPGARELAHAFRAALARLPARGEAADAAVAAARDAFAWHIALFAALDPGEPARNAPRH